MNDFNGKNTPCNGCVMCCQGDAVGLYPQENMKYQSEKHCYFPGEKMLAHKPNGDCVYIEADGCQIHGYRPIKCQTMDCRIIFKMLSPSAALRNGLIKIWNKGKELCEN